MSRHPRRRVEPVSEANESPLPVVAKSIEAPGGMVKGSMGLLRFLLPPGSDLAANWRAVLWAMLSVALFWLCFPPFNLWPLAFFALVPWLWGLRRTSTRTAFWISWIFGTVHCITIYSWLAVLERFNPAIYLGIPLLALFQGIFYAIKGAGMVYFGRKLAPWLAFVMAALWWAGWEWFRSVGALGNPFALLGHAASGFLPLLQVVSLGGVVLLSAIVLLANLSLMEMIAAAKLRAFDVGVLSRAGTSTAVLIVSCMFGAAVVRNLDARAEQESTPLRVAVLQPNVDQDEKFASYASEDAAAREELQNRMTRDLFALLDAIEPGSVDLIVAPESAFTQENFDLNKDLQREIRERVNTVRAALIAGGNDNVFYTAERKLIEDPYEAIATLKSGEQLDYELYGGFFVFQPGDTDLRRQAQYRKIHLMPFGETVPYFDKIPGLQEHLVKIATFMRGDSVQPPIFIDVDSTPENPADAKEKVFLAPSICFEDLFAYLTNRIARRGAQLHVNITNNGWFDPSIGSAYHYAFARLRAPETRLPMILCTNTGVTAVIDASGRVIGELPKREAGTLTTTIAVPLEPGLTLYARFGDWFGILSFVAGIGMLAFIRFARKRGVAVSA